ncbi:nocobactin polyketide synthase NbtC [Nocardia seriolae]|uniref:Erythronolide synthase, modules 1 and n=1 Tax=Nocardia seriolae TaxID=37332 RepID=A0A0B8NGS8_9NOCA|nr:nocobactin polyketide synthase NbtC [Nocardia seriolae]APB01626.1 Erythronolide synthase, modules 1 and [Nocardia seriolae]MTJ60900.1 nocobactin polyketide synthase NbtC [Nocardia seriolae]MTJ73958.1 nocobactin polyketide synthase NbtC [Nocardia seriolae]MTJ90963.1 nocobactin polyketide synthase NbtC [Nocardia seriolae]MTK34920.1 nocobactin polyketide synthase NbtC [Nocardia seriolae]
MSEYRLPDGTIPVLLSSETPGGLRAEAAQLARYLADRPEVTPNRVADMLFRTRTARRRRALAMVSGRDELLSALDAIAADAEHPAVVSGLGAATARRVGFVFPGQGSQRPGMGKLYYGLSRAYRDEVDACAELHREYYGHAQPLHYLLGEEGRFENTVWEVQPALMFHMTGLAAMWRAAGVEPAAAIGHSQGELAAGWVARVMTRRDAVMAVTQRARLVERISPRGYSMAVLGMDREAVEAMLARHSGWAELSVVNSPHILAISGDRETIVDLVAAARAQGRFAKEIQVAYPAHTSIVAELRADFEEFLGDEMSTPTFTAGDIPCYGATLGAEITPDLEHEQYWYWNLRNRVRFDRAIVAAAVDGIDTFVEVAEHPTLQLAVQENLGLVPPDPALPSRAFRVLGTSLRTADSLRDFTRNLATVAVHDLAYNWQALRTEGTVSLPLRDFPNTVMNPQRLWASFESPAGQPIPETTHRRPHRLAENWIRLDKRSLVPPRDLLVVDHTGRNPELAAAICTAAHNHGGSARVMSQPDAAADGLVDRADCDIAGSYDTVVILLPALPDIEAPQALEQAAAFFAEPSWLPELAGVTDCWLVTVGGEQIAATDPVPHQFHGAVTAGYRCLGMESLGVAFRRVDLAVGQADASQAAALVRAVHVKNEPELALRDGAVYAKRLEIDAAQPGPARDIDLEHVVIIGGTGTLGMEFCAHYARRGARRITLLSRSGETDAVSRRLRPIRVLGDTEIIVESCDVTDVEAVLELAARQQVPATVLVHAGVNYVRAELAEVTPEKFREMAGSKIYGTEHILSAWPRTQDCKVVLCSSAAATFGGRGQILYATVNRMLDVLARRLRAQGVDAVAMQWGLWDLEGPLHAVGTGPVQAAGVTPMRAADALELGFTEHADHSGTDNRLVAAADWNDVRALMAAIGQGPLLDDVVVAAAAEEAARLVNSNLSAVAASPPGEASRSGGEPTAGDSQSFAGVGHSRTFPASVSGQVGSALDPATPGRGPVNLAEQVRRQLGKVMGADTDGLDTSVPLVALGLDSLQALDFRKRVQVELDRELPVAAILGGASLDDVVRLMAGSQA